ncbi:hypothetical protein [Hoeflea sp.]|uniref:hypothetical protein n=1 Tax=Hoeflea sp. TaxID=1940281 RepID=UPI003A93C585
MKNLTFGLIVASSIASTAMAQGGPAYQETGVITMTLGAQEVTHYTTWNTVPGDATRQVHTASWLILKPMVMGGVNISPDDVFVTMTTRDTVSPKFGQPEMRVEFSLDPVTLELKADPAATLSYHPADSDSDVYYALTNGSFQVESVTRLADDTLAIIATAKGEMSGQQSSDISHNPNDIMPLNARFELKQVVKRGGIPLP